MSRDEKILNLVLFIGVVMLLSVVLANELALW